MLKERLRTARKNAKKTQLEVATAIGVTESTYCGYETGKRQPDALKIGAIASFLGVSGDYLLEIAGEEKKDALPEPDRTLLEYFHELNEEGQEKLIDYADDLVRSEKYTRSSASEMAAGA